MIQRIHSSVFSYCSCNPLRFGVYDEAEVIAVHGVGGLLGMVVLPLFRQDDLGLFYQGGLDAAKGLGIQLYNRL